MLFPPSYLFWKARYGTCWVFVYLFYPGGANDSECALYIVGKIFSMGVQRNWDRGDRLSSNGENAELIWKQFWQSYILLSQYLINRIMDFHRVWYLRKALIKENPATQVTRYEDEFPPRMSAITGMAPFGSSLGYCCLPNWVPFFWPLPLTQPMSSFDSMRFQGFKYFQVGMGL